MGSTAAAAAVRLSAWGAGSDYMATNRPKDTTCAPVCPDY